MFARIGAYRAATAWVAGRSARERPTITPASATNPAAVTSVTAIPADWATAASPKPAITSPTYSA
jgi:hypothetical protein